jgi:transposase
MQTIGIDMAKDTFHAAFDDRTVTKFENTPAGIEKFMTTLEDDDFPITDTRIGVEATGVYHLLFAVTLREHSWDVVVINPLESHRMITQGLRTVKTDRLDALKIRTMTGMGKGYLFTDTKDVLALKALVVERQALVEMRKMTKQRMDVHRLKEAATGMTLHDSFTAIKEVLSAKIKHIERSMQGYETETQELLRSIPGIGITTAAALVAFIGDVNRFATPEKLVAYIGLDCRVYQSGTSVQGKGYISKRGNGYLRHMLFNAAFIARQHNPDLKRYHEQKLGEGKHYFSAMCAVERKLVHLIYAVWKRGTPFVQRTHEKTAGVNSPDVDKVA